MASGATNDGAGAENEGGNRVLVYGVSLPFTVFEREQSVATVSLSPPLMVY
jgi:hypothetical protein